MNQCLCRAEHVFLTRNGQPVLQGVDCSIRSGEMLIIAGPNGSGKSTLLKIFAGLLTPDSGEVLFALRGTVVSLLDMDLRSRGQHIAYLSQNTEEDIPFTVEEAVSLGRAPWQNILGRETPLDRQICLKSLEDTESRVLAERPLGQLSGGEQQRVFISRALCQTPRLLLLDEPTSAQDYRHQELLMRMLKKHCAAGLAVIMVTHDLNLASLYADTVLLLHQGQGKGLGSPDDILTQETLREVYQCDLLLDTHPCTGTPRISLPVQR